MVWIKFGRVLHEVVSGSELSLVVFFMKLCQVLN